jgi:AraC-like DNA-binding protein
MEGNAMRDVRGPLANSCSVSGRAFAPASRGVVGVTRVSLSLGTLDVLTGREMREHFPPHVHEFFAFGVIDGGASDLRYRGASSVASAGAVVAIPPGQLHTGEPLGEAGWSYKMIYPGADLVAQALGRDAAVGAEDVFFPEAVMDDPPLAAEIRAVHAALTRVECPLHQDVALSRLLRLIVERHARSGAPASRLGAGAPRAVQIAKAYLEAHFDEPVRLAELAAVAGLSPFHLVRQFRRYAGMPPHAWLKHLRVRRARRMLQGGATLTGTAFGCGFSDQSHFGRTFKSVMGLSPGGYVRGLSRAVGSAAAERN